MFSDNRKNNENLRNKAFSQFKKVAETEQADGVETLAYHRLVPQFSSAPNSENEGYLILMNYWSRGGHKKWLAEAGTELFHWARNNGYRHG